MDTKRSSGLPFRALKILGPPAVALAVLLAACTSAAPPRKPPAPPAATIGLPSPSPLDSTVLSADPIVEVVKRVAPAVVNVTTATVSSDSLFGGGSQPGKAVGTGFVIRSDGFIVTNFHVVEGALNIKVTLPPPDGRTFTARVIGGDSDHDVAVLEVEGTGLPTVAHDLPAGARRLKQKADGVLATIVNGEVVLRNNEHTGALPGSLLRGPLAGG